MLYQRGKARIWWYRFRFGGRIVHESAKTASKTLAIQAERQRRRELEQSWNHVGGAESCPRRSNGRARNIRNRGWAAFRITLRTLTNTR